MTFVQAGIFGAHCLPVHRWRSRATELRDRIRQSLLLQSLRNLL